MKYVSLDEYLEALQKVKEYELYIVEHGGLANVPIADAGLSNRAYNALKNLSAFTKYHNRQHYPLPSFHNKEARVYHLSVLSRNGLLRCRNVGKKTVDEIENLLLCAGLKLSQDDR